MSYCPSCHEVSHRVAEIYDQQTYYVNGSPIIGAALVNSQVTPGLGFSFGHSEQSRLANKLSPPQRSYNPIGLLLTGLIICLSIPVIFGQGIGESGFLTLSMISFVLIGALVLSMRSHRKKDQNYYSQLHSWGDSYYCSRCHAVYNEEEDWFVSL